MKQWIIGFYLVCLCTTFMPFYLKGINILFIVSSVITIAALLLSDLKNYKLLLSLSGVIFFCLLSITFILHFSSGKFSSLFYSLFFISQFYLIVGNAKNSMTKEAMSNILLVVINLLFAGLLLQQICVAFDLPVININPYFKEGYIEESGMFRLNSLTPEPSYGATIIIALSYFFYQLRGFRKKDIITVWFPVAYSLYVFQSVLGFILFAIIVMVLLLRERWWMLPLAIVGILPIVRLLISEESRIGLILNNLDVTSFMESMVTTDLSGAYRIVPAFLYFQKIDISSLSTYIGYGQGHAGNFIADIMPGIELGDRFMGGLIPSMLYDHGIICFIAFLIFCYRVSCTGNRVVYTLILFFILLNANLNTQLLWAFVGFSAILKLLSEHTVVPKPLVQPHKLI